MSATPGDNAGARARILGRVRSAVGAGADAARRAAAATDHVAAHAHGPRPVAEPDVVARFARRARDMASTVQYLQAASEIPRAVAAYIDGLVLPDALAVQRTRAGVCWPQFRDLDWAGAGLAIDVRPTAGADRLGITGCFCAIAETGTLVFTSGADTPTATALLPDTHIAVLSAARIVAGMEESFALSRAENNAMPRAINHISGPSRTGDIEQTIVLGAHGPFRVHILLLP